MSGERACGSGPVLAPARRELSLRPARPWLLAAGAWLAALALIGYVVVSAVTGHMVDLGVYRAGALAVLHGGNLYSMRTAARLQFTYPPIAAILAVPLTLLSFRADSIAWIAVVYIPLVIATRIGFRPLLARAGRAAPAVFAVILGCCAYLVPVREEMALGQIDLLLVALCLVDLTAARPRWPRGLLIGLATAIKLEPGVFIVYLLITKRRKEAAVAALSFACLTALAYVIDPRDSVAYWTSAIFQTNRLGGNGSAAHQSLRGMILRLHLHLAPAAVWLPVALIVGVAGFAAARACWRRGDDLAGITITGLLGAALSPLAWIHHLCWVVVAIGLIAGDGRSKRRVAAAALTGVLFMTWVPVWAEHLMDARKLAFVAGFLPEDSFGLAALAVMLILLRVRQSAGAAAGSPADLPSSADAQAGQLPTGTG
jgi:alpha-1,2-mannosyltransferase